MLTPPTLRDRARTAAFLLALLACSAAAPACIFDSGDYDGGGRRTTGGVGEGGGTTSSGDPSPTPTSTATATPTPEAGGSTPPADSGGAG